MDPQRIVTSQAPNYDTHEGVSGGGRGCSLGAPVSFVIIANISATEKLYINSR